MAGSGDGLANGGKVGLSGGDSSSGNGELGYGVEGSGVLPSAVKFTLEIKLDYFHIAQGHADVLVSEHLHERPQANAQAHHLGCEEVAQPVRVDPAGATRKPGHFGQGVAQHRIPSRRLAVARQ